MELGEGTEIVRPARPRRKRTVHIRVTIFFDGTGNNRANIRYREAHPWIYWWWSLAKPKLTDSYESDLSNVVRLAEHLEDASDGYQAFIPVYVEGIGTTDEKADDLVSYGFGTRFAGVVWKATKGAHEALYRVTQQFRASDVVIGRLSVDTCGFSRGAAAARHCVHRVLVDEQARFKTVLERLGYEVAQVDVPAVGLFDTVSSYGFSLAGIFDAEYADNVARLHLNAVARAADVFQLAAAEEYRERFSLTNINSAAGKGRQIYLPGAHSDIGGGYCDGEDEKQELVVGGASRTVASFMLTRGWYVGGIDGPELHYAETVNSSVVGYGQYSAYIPEHVTGRRTAIRRAYTFIPLHLMADFLRTKGVPVSEEVEGLFVRTNVPGRARIESYAAGVTGVADSQPSDWEENVQADTKALRHGHLHVSFRNDATGMGARLTPKGRPYRRVYHG